MKEDRKLRYIDPHTVQHYLESKGSKKERKKIAEWFSDILANDELRKFTYNRWQTYSEDKKRHLYDEERIHDRIHHILRLEEATSLKKDRLKRTILKYTQRIAAVLILPLALFAILNLEGNLGSNQEQSNATIYAPPGARTNFTLPDGSEGWLNVGSYLSFPTKFSGKRRTVHLVGEAYFHIKRNQKKPFIVETEELRIKVLGTSFNLMAYPDEDDVEISLDEGKIEVLSESRTGADKSLGILNPGEIGRFWKESHLFRINSAETSSYSSWKEGKLVIDNESMDQVVRKLNRWYNVEIILMDDRLKDFTYHATFVDEQLEEVLKIFSLTSPIVYEELEREKSADGTYKKRIIEFYYDPK